MTLKEYRKEHELSQGDMVEMLQPFIPWLNRPLFSLYERGLVESDEITACIHSVFDLESDLGSVVDKHTDEALKPLKTDFTAFEVYMPLTRSSEPLSRAQLVQMTGLSDREVRKQIKELRDLGVRIASSSNTNGYWICTEEEDYRRLRAEMYSRVASIARTIRAMDSNLPGQIRMDE